MQVDSPSKLRTVALAGHNDTGKTTPPARFSSPPEPPLA